MSFSNLKKKSNSLEKLSQELEKINRGGESYKDDRFWNLERDKSGNAYAVIRFLPACEGEDIPWARIFSHGFQGPSGVWYIENCPTTLGGKCPVCEANSVQWNSGKEGQEVARKRKRKLSYVANILVISDPSNRENEGKVFLFRFGKKIFDKITESMQPKYEDEKPINPFDFWNGRNFKLKIKTVAGYANYDDSSFDSSAVLCGFDDVKLEKIWKSQTPLAEFNEEKQFKSYEELTKKFASVTSGAGAGKKTVVDDSEEPPFETKIVKKSTVSVIKDDDSEDAADYLEKLMKEQG